MKGFLEKVKNNLVHFSAFPHEKSIVLNMEFILMQTNLFHIPQL